MTSAPADRRCSDEVYGARHTNRRHSRSGWTGRRQRIRRQQCPCQNRSARQRFDSESGTDRDNDQPHRNRHCSSPRRSGSSLAPEIMASSTKWGVPPEILSAIIRIESQGEPGPISPAGARGLVQMMPDGLLNHGVPQSLWHDPTTNIEAGAWGLAWRFTAQGSWPARSGHTSASDVISTAPAPMSTSTRFWAGPPTIGRSSPIHCTQVLPPCLPTGVRSLPQSSDAKSGHTRTATRIHDSRTTATKTPKPGEPQRCRQSCADCSARARTTN